MLGHARFILCAILLFVFAPVALAQQTGQQSAPPPDPAKQIAAARADLKRIDQALGQENIDDRRLQDLRSELDPIAATARSVVDELTPRLAAVKARLDQLGPPPKADAPPENPSVTSERKQQQKSYDTVDSELKQARLLSVDVDQMTDRIVARRRARFASAVFSRSYSILDLSLWSNAVRDVPADAAAAASVFTDLFSGIWTRLGPVYGGGLLALLAVIASLYVYLASVARRILAREPATAEPTPLAKLLGAFVVALITASVPILCTVAIVAALRYFSLVPDGLQPLLRSIVGGVVRVSLTAGLARALLAPGRPNWRLLDLSDATCERLVRLALSIAFIVSFGKMLDAIYDLIAASLPVAVATRAVLAWAVAIVMAISLRGIVPDEEPEDECLGPNVTAGRDWYGPLRLLAWAVIVTIFVAVLVGYIAFATFLVDQLVWISFIGTMLYLLLGLTSEGIARMLQPRSPLGRGFVTSVGLRRGSLGQLSAILSGALSVALFAIAAMLILAPWGIQSDDMFGSLQAAFFGFRIGDVTISLSSIALALLIFALGLAVTRGLQNWLDQRYLPLTSLDTGLRNSIRTSLGYVGFILAAAFSLGEVGLDFQKLAIVAGALSVGIGFGLQSIVNNFVSGLIILWERAIRVGDWVVVGDEQGHVRRINVRSTEIETFDRATMIVPNSNLVTGVVKNWVRGDKSGRIRIPVSIPLALDPERVREALIACAREQDLVLRIPAPQVTLMEITRLDLKFELIVYVADVESSLRARSDLNFAILRRFKEDGIELVPAPPPPVPPAVINFQGLDRLEKFIEISGAEPAAEKK